MKHGILITAYKNFTQLIELIDYFDNNFEIFIHIDNKSKIPNNISHTLKGIDNVKLISNKYKVNWGGLNHLKSILHLSSEALKSSSIQYFHLISGQDFPVKQKSYFLDFFDANKGNDYLENFELPASVWNYGGMDRVEYYNFYDIFDAKKKQKLITDIIQLQQKYNIKRSISNKIPKLYGGSTWWSLTRETLNYVLTYTKDNKYFINRLKHTFCSEEIYFQSVIMNSKFSKNVINDNLRYIDWNERNNSLPAILDIFDYRYIKKSNKIFARKFDPLVSEKLKQKIKTRLF